MATSSNSVEFKLVGRDQTKAAITQATRNLRSLDQNVRSTSLSIGTLAKGFAAFQVGSQMLDGAKAVASFSISVEQTKVAFQTLLGSADAAEKRVRSLTEFSAKTPFEMRGVIEANRLLQALTGGALATEEGMRLVGDAAAAAGRDLQETSMWVGRLYAGLESGTPVGEATARLLEMGLISGDTKRELEALAADGALGANEAMRKLEETFGATSGAMELQSKTLGGMITTLKDFATTAVAQLPIVEGAFESLKNQVEATLELLGATQRGGNPVRKLFTEIRADLLNAANAGEITTSQFSEASEKLERFLRAENIEGLNLIRERFLGVAQSTEKLNEATSENIEITKEQQKLIDDTLSMSDKMALDLLGKQERQLEMARRQVDAYMEQNFLLQEQGEIDAETMRERLDLAGQWLDHQYNEILAVDEKHKAIEEKRRTHSVNMGKLAEQQAQMEARARDYAARATADGFGNMAFAAAQFFGQQSAAFKAFAIGEAIANTFRAANQVMADPTVIAWAKIPLAATVIAAGIANVASIAQAHSGATNIPNEGTYLLNRGERVLAPEQNRDLTDALERGGIGGGQTQIVIDGEVLASTLMQMANDGRFTIPARAVA